METLPLPSGFTAHYALFTIANAAALRTRLIAASQLAADEEGDAERERLNFAFIDAAMVSIPRKTVCPGGMAADRPLCVCRLPLACTSSPQSRRRSSLSLTTTSRPRLFTPKCSSTSTLAPTYVPLSVWGSVPPADATAASPPPASPLTPPPDAQISDSLKHFGLSPSTTSLLLVHLAPSEDAGGLEAEEVLLRMEALVEGGVQALDLLGALPEGKTNYKAIRKVSRAKFMAFGVSAGMLIPTRPPL